jgi:hypothetical protein
MGVGTRRLAQLHVENLLRFDHRLCARAVLFQDCTKKRNEELAEAVPEALKNMLLVMNARGVLVESWTVSAAEPVGWPQNPMKKPGPR